MITKTSHYALMAVCSILAGLPFSASAGTVPGPLPLVATLDPANRNLLPDAKGAYIDGIEWASVRGGAFFSIAPYNVGGVKGKLPAALRALKYDLNDPVPGTGAKARGIVTDPIANHVLVCWHAAGSTAGGFLDIPIGATVVSEATEIHFRNTRSNGGISVLQFGGACSDHGGAHGNGSNPPLITRNSETSWTIDFQSGSAGRLWTTSGDSGLHYFSGVIQIVTK